ncbi:hypothetical protein TNCV_1088871 [Trichonephila clavipes]|uniref:Uncharacterized protein n=1 Tax=Trichonephila clavipes TaxID=2585209 RepID=A0A8X6SPA9_TRICX|nr:hypothetical protein TNCV_1088871 [Trichonephila clavipes]
MKIHRFRPESNPQPWVQKASDKPTTPPSNVVPSKHSVTSLLRTSRVVGIVVGPDTHTCILQLQRNSFLTPEESNTVDRKRRDALNLHGSGGQRILLSQNIGL